MEKLNLSTSVKDLTQVQLGHVVSVIKAKSPTAYKEVDRDNCQIVVDNLNKATFEDLTE